MLEFQQKEINHYYCFFVEEVFDFQFYRLAEKNYFTLLNALGLAFHVKKYPISKDSQYQIQFVVEDKLYCFENYVRFSNLTNEITGGPRYSRVWYSRF